MKLTFCSWCARLTIVPVFWVASYAHPFAQIRPVVDIEKVRSLYVAAAYEEALAAMPPADGEPARSDVEQYRALCLLALGREGEAVTAVERLIRDNPSFMPPEGDTSPRMQTMFRTARSRLLPQIVKASYAEAKAAYDAKNRDAALTGFRRAIALIDSLPEADAAALTDLRVLASGFVDLLAVAPAAVEKPAVVPEAPVVSNARAEYVAPVVIREQLPSWTPPDAAAMRTEYVGLLRVEIGVDGKVESASLVKRTHPVYDAAALRAAKQWLYKPATRGGQPVAAYRDIQVRLLPK